MKMNDKYFFSDSISKVVRRLCDYLYYPYWYIRIGKIGKGSRIKRGVKIVGNARRVEIGNNQIIWHNCVFAVGAGNIKIGHNGHVAVGCYMNASIGVIQIGNNVKVGTMSQIYSYSYFLDKKSKMEEEYKGKEVIIKDNVHIGSGAVILPGVTIGEYAIVGACAVVSKDVPPYTIVGGIPAKEISKRK